MGSFPCQLNALIGLAIGSSEIFFGSLVASELSGEGDQVQAMEIAEGIDRLAKVTVELGLDLQPGQQLIIANPDGPIPMEALPLVLRLTEHAYQAGASLVTPLFTVDASVRARAAIMPAIFNMRTNWSLIPVAMPAWARAAFPQDGENAAYERLWRAIFKSTYLVSAKSLSSETTRAFLAKTRSFWITASIQARTIILVDRFASTSYEY